MFQRSNENFYIIAELSFVQFYNFEEFDLNFFHFKGRSSFTKKREWNGYRVVLYYSIRVLFVNLKPHNRWKKPFRTVFLACLINHYFYSSVQPPLATFGKIYVIYETKVRVNPKWWKMSLVDILMMTYCLFLGYKSGTLKNILEKTLFSWNDYFAYCYANVHKFFWLFQCRNVYSLFYLIL